MSTAAYYQRAEAIDYTNDGDDVIETGTIITLSERVGVAGDDIASGDTGAVHITGAYTMPKSSANEITVGTSVYYDGTGITEDSTADGAVSAGFAIATAAADDTEIIVKIG